MTLSKGERIAQLIADEINKDGGIGPMGGEELIPDENILTFTSQGPDEIFQINDDGSIDWMNIEECINKDPEFYLGYNPDEELDEDEAGEEIDDFIKEFRYQPSIKDSDLTWFMNFSKKVYKQIDDIVHEPEEDPTEFEIIEKLEVKDNLNPTTPYMLRDDGALISCGTMHPYILMSVKSSLDTNIKTLDNHPEFLDWFEVNTNKKSTKDLINKYKTTKNPEILEKLNTAVNDEFCKVRTSNYKVPVGGNNGEIYFRISSSNGFNWFDLIYDTVLKYINSIDKITIMKDSQAFKDVKDFDYYKVKNQEINHMELEDFLTLGGNPIIESVQEEHDTLNPKLFDGEELKAKIKEIIDKYKEDKDSKLGILEVEPGNDAFIKHYDNEDVDFGSFIYHPEGEHEDENGITPALITFTLTGGLNGWGELSNWGLYLENVSKLFKELEEETGLHIEIQDIENDIPDDVWTAQVLMYKKDTDLEESLNKLIESLSNHFNKDIGEDIEKHNTLNPVLFDGEELKPEIREAIEKIVNEFVEGLAEDNIKFNLKDVVLVGSNVSYNYTKDSDLDVHLIADSTNLSCPDDLYPLLYSAYRSMFNSNYDITLKGIPVELYIEMDQPTGRSNGVYSLNNGWLKKPVQQDIPDLDQDAFEKLFKEWEDKYFDLIGEKETLTEQLSQDDYFDFVEDIYHGTLNIYKDYESKGVELTDVENAFQETLGHLEDYEDIEPTEILEDTNTKSEQIKNFIEDLYDLRKSSILQDGEYGLGNLVFKEFRNLGYLDHLKELRKQERGKELSLESKDNK